MSKILNEYEAAATLSISPELLKYCASHTVKSGHTRKLVGTKNANGLFSFEEDELLSYDKYLREEWPSSMPGERPHLPDAFKTEIRTEACGECAICLANGNSCEAAHIAAVHKSKSHHPHNLIWLCANHHTKFDKGLIGPKDGLKDLVRLTKGVMRERRRLAHIGAGEVANALATLLNVASQLDTAHKKAAPADRKITEKIAVDLVALLPDVLKRNKNSKLQPVLDKVKACIDTIPPSTHTSTGALQVLNEVGALEAELVHEAGLKSCPLCKGTRWYRECDCPVCQGEGAVAQNYEFDPELFESKTCPVCGGDGRRDCTDCPGCSGQGNLDAYLWERVDWTMFDKVRCELCKGSCRHNDQDCPACGGEGQMDSYIAEATDWASFLKVKCRLCKGTGQDDWGTCPVCQGEATIEKRVDQQIDWSEFKKVSCRLCNGTGIHNREECPACHGQEKMYSRDAERIDWAMFHDSKCPLCIGSGNHDHGTCPECYGEGRMESWRAQNLDLSKYQSSF